MLVNGKKQKNRSGRNQEKYQVG